MSKLRSTPDPTSTYEEAVVKIDALQNRPTPSPILPVSRTIFLSHGKRTQRGIVFFHGYTNSPHQFRMLGERFHALGYNVLIPRMPHHGLVDRLTPDIKNQTSAKLIAVADQAIDAAAGFAEEITVMGLSMGGVVSSWVAQVRPEVSRVFIISPAFGADVLPNWLIPSLSRLLRTLPDRYVWWGEEGIVEDRQPHTYPRMTSHGLAHMWKLGLEVRRLAASRKPAAENITLVLNTNDKSIDYQMAADLDLLWTKQGVPVRRFEFGLEDNLDHDLIDPEHEFANMGLVNPILESLVRSA